MTKKELTDILYRKYDCVALSYKEVAKELGVDYRLVGNYMLDAGLTVKQLGIRKKVLIGDLASMLLSEHVSPVEKTCKRKY